MIRHDAAVQLRTSPGPGIFGGECCFSPASSSTGGKSVVPFCGSPPVAAAAAIDRRDQHPGAGACQKSLKAGPRLIFQGQQHLLFGGLASAYVGAGRLRKARTADRA